MGSNPASIFANVFLYHYEDGQITQLKKSDMGCVDRFAYVPGLQTTLQQLMMVEYLKEAINTFNLLSFSSDTRKWVILRNHFLNLEIIHKNYA